MAKLENKSKTQTPEGKTRQQITNLDQMSFGNSEFQSKDRNQKSARHSKTSELFGGLLTPDEYRFMRTASAEEFVEATLESIKPSDEQSTSDGHCGNEEEVEEDYDEPIKEYLEQEKFTKF